MRRIIAFCVVVFVAVFLCLFVSGKAIDASVIHDISPFALEKAADGVLNGFSETNEGWDCNSSDAEVTLAEKIRAFPYQPLTDEGCLIVRSGNVSSGEKNYIEKNYYTPIDISESSSVIFLVNCSEVASGKYFVNGEIYSGNDSLVFTEEICCGGWSGIFVDVSEWENRDEITKIRLTVYFESVNAEAGIFEYYVDSIMTSDNANAYTVAAMAAADYVTDSGRIGYLDGVFTIVDAGDEVRITSRGFAYGNMGKANGIMLEFITEGYCQGVRLFVKRGEGRFAEEGYSSVNLSNTEGSVFLPLTGEDISEISLEFEGVMLGTVRIFGISPASYVYQDSDSGVNVNTCVLNASTGEIIIRGTVDRSVLPENGGELHLFANDLCDGTTLESVSMYTPLQKSKITSGDFIFRVDFDGNSEGRSLICKKFTVAVKSADEYICVGNSKCVANPEGFAGKDVSVPSERSGKGLYGESIAFMQSVGASDTVIWVDIGSFFVQESGVNSRFECGGNLFYYNSEYFSSIDTMIKNYAEKDIDVTLVFVVSDTGNEALNRVLIHKDADTDAKYCAYNTADRQGLMYLRAITDFFASRYCAESEVTRFVFGDCVGDAATNYNMGEKTLDEFVSQYSSGLRIIYNTARSYSPYVNVYTYIDDNWDKGLPFDIYVRYDNKAFLDALDGCISGMGDFAWGVAQNPYPVGVSDYFSYDDADLETHMLADRVSFKNIGIIVDYLKRGAIAYNNNARDYIIIEQSSFDKLSEEQITADYIYNCYKALNTAVSAYITDRNCNYNNAMKYVDTNFSLTASGFVSDVLGVATWESVIEGFSGKNIEKRTITTGRIMPATPNVVGSLLLSDFSGGVDGWHRYGFTERLSGTAELSGKKDLLSLSLGNVSVGESRGIIKKFDSPKNMRNSPIVHFEINVASLPTNVDFANMTVFITSGNNIYEITGSVAEAVWTDVYCDFSGFSGIDKVDSMGVIFLADENYFDSPQALFTSFELVSTEYDSDTLKQMNSESTRAEEFLDQIKVYLYPSLIVLIVLSISILVWRRFVKLK